MLWLLSVAQVAALRNAGQNHNSSELKEKPEVWENRQSPKDRRLEHGGPASLKIANFTTGEARTIKDREPHAQIEMDSQALRLSNYTVQNVCNTKL